jgi:serine/threonine-protein kinase
VVVGGILIAGVTGFLAGRRYERQRATTFPPSRLSVAGTLIGWGSQQLQRQLSLSPDGSTLFYVTPTQNGRGQLVSQRLDAAEPTPVPGVPIGTTAPVFSPDAQTFIAWPGGERQAYRYRVAGGEGTPVEITGGYTAFAQWDVGGLWYSPTNGGGVWRVADGDSATPRMDSTSRRLRLQQVLSDGRHALVLTHSETATAPVAVFDMRAGTTSSLLTTSVVEARYAAGYLLYVLPSGAIEAAPFDESKQRVTGPSVQIGTGVSVTGNGVAQFAVAANGTIAYAVEETPSLVFVDRSGASHAALEDRRTYHGPRFSPDGRRLAFDFIATDGRDVWVLSLDDRALTRASFERDGHDVVWMPDGRHISFLSARSGKEAVYKKAAAGTEPAERLFESAQLGFTGMWLGDGSAFVPQMNDLRPGTGSDIAIVGNGGRGPATPFAASEFGESHPAVSPNSRWLAFTSDQSGRQEVYVRPLQGDGDQVQVSINGGTEAVWSHDGSAIFFRSVGLDQPQLIEARVQSAPAFAVVSRRPLFPIGDIIPGNPHANYDVSPDGKTFAMVRRSPASRIMVIQNLPALVRAAAAPPPK